MFENKQIKNVDDWKLVAPPMGGDTQWKKGRSAFELANYICSSPSGMPEELKDAIIETGVKKQNFSWVPEYVTNFETSVYGNGEGRHHDLAMFGENCFAGVEAKADEPFDKPVAKWLLEGGSEGSSNNRKRRINAMCNLLFGENYSEKHARLHYQLFSALTGTILEAEKQGKENAILVVITFKMHYENGKPAYKDEKIKANETAFDTFLKMFPNYNEQSGLIGSIGKVKNVFVKHITITD